MRLLKALTSFSILGLCILSISCAPSRTGRIKADDEADLVGDRAAGTVVYRQVIDEGLKSLSEKYRAGQRGNPSFTKIKVAFLGVENKGTQPIGPWRHQINDIINLAVNDSQDFQDLAFDEFIKPALDAVRVRKDQLVLPANQEALSRELRKNGATVDALLFANLTEGVTSAGRVSQSDYRLTFKLIPIVGDQAGTQLIAAGDIKKEYTR